MAIFKKVEKMDGAVAVAAPEAARTVVVRYVGLDSKVEQAIKSVVGRDPDSSEFSFPSAGGELYRVRVLRFKAGESEAAHMINALHAVAGVEQYLEQ